MSEAIYTPNPASIPKFLSHIQSAGVPPKVSQQYLSSVGFKSSNDRYLLSVMKAIGFVDTSGIPTERWKEFRNKSRARRVLGLAVREAYSELFRTYPDAHRKDNEALRNFFSTHSSKLGESTLGLVVRTFKTLADNADFDADDLEELILEEVTEKKPPRPAPAAPAYVPAINVNIQLQLPATDDATVYEKLFEALRTKLLNGGTKT